MKDEIMIKFPESNEVGEITVRTNLDKYYRTFMEALTVDGSEKESKFLANIQCIVWGALYLEALVNRLSEKSLEALLKEDKKNATAIWAVAERADLDKKVTVLLTITGCSEQEISECLNKIKKISRIRNRIVHYKEAPAMIDPSWGERTPKQGMTVMDMLNSLPDPKIIHEVLSQSLEERKKEIIGMADWMISLCAQRKE